ncbi:MAG: hypothetical protein H0U15_05035 [Geodermatophilaceae bacterium]|nr:hypothetical protein [Geodermatophilaceae bacterium]
MSDAALAGASWLGSVDPAVRGTGRDLDPPGFLAVRDIVVSGRWRAGSAMPESQQRRLSGGGRGPP